MREKLIEAGVKNLRAYGYPSATPENILKDEIYRAFFVSMLEDNKGRAGADVDKVIDGLISECRSAA